MKRSQKEQIEDLFQRPAVKKRVDVVHLQMMKEDRCLYGLQQMRNAQQVVDMIRPLIQMADREMNLVLSLSTRLEPLAVEITAIGALNCIYLDVKNVFKHAILSNAAYVVCIHNHPSGDVEPSEEDRVVTRRLARAGELLGIALLDHIIIGDEGYYSFQKQGDLQPLERAG